MNAATPKRKPGRQEWIPDLQHIEDLAARGLTNEQIAAACGISRSTLDPNTKPGLEDAINKGRARGIGYVANALFENAVKRRNVVAQIFYLKARAGWRDNVAILEMTPDQIAAAMAAHLKAAQETDAVLAKAAVDKVTT